MRKTKGDSARSSTCWDLAVLAQLLPLLSPYLPLPHHSAWQWVWKVTWLQQRFCCGTAPAWSGWQQGAGKFGEMLTSIFTGSEISSKEEPEDGCRPEKELSAWLHRYHVPTCECVEGRLLGWWEGAKALLCLFVFPAKAFRPKPCRSWVWWLALFPVHPQSFT